MTNMKEREIGKTYIRKTENISIYHNMSKASFESLLGLFCKAFAHSLSVFVFGGGLSKANLKYNVHINRPSSHVLPVARVCVSPPSWH